MSFSTTSNGTNTIPACWWFSNFNCWEAIKMSTRSVSVHLRTSTFSHLQLTYSPPSGVYRSPPTIHSLPLTIHLARVLRRLQIKVVKYNHLGMLILYTTQCCSANNNQGDNYDGQVLQASELLYWRAERDAWANWLIFLSDLSWGQTPFKYNNVLTSKVPYKNLPTMGFNLGPLGWWEADVL